MPDLEDVYLIGDKIRGGMRDHNELIADAPIADLPRVDLRNRVLTAAKSFFARAQSVYVAFVEREGPGHVVLRGQGGEEVVVAARAHEGATEVTGSSYLFDAQVARFLSTLPVAVTP